MAVLGFFGIESFSLEIDFSFFTFSDEGFLAFFRGSSAGGAEMGCLGFLVGVSGADLGQKSKMNNLKIVHNNRCSAAYHFVNCTEKLNRYRVLQIYAGVLEK